MKERYNYEKQGYNFRDAEQIDWDAKYTEWHDGKQDTRKKTNESRKESKSNNGLGEECKSSRQGSRQGGSRNSDSRHDSRYDASRNSGGRQDSRYDAGRNSGGKQGSRYNGDKSYSQQKRDQMDYRKEYFKHNPGLFGCIWKCAYCGKLILFAHNVQVDHIMPLNNPLGLNKRFNLVAACPKCNRDKSDKVDARVAVGYASKLVDTGVFSIQKIFLVVLVGLWNFILMVLKLLGELLLKPLKSDATWVTKLIVILVYCLVIYVLIHLLI